MGALMEKTVQAPNAQQRLLLRSLKPSLRSSQKKKTHKPPPHFFSRQLKPKPLPPPLLNKHKKVWQQYVKMGIVVVALLALVGLFLVGNGDYYVNIKFSRYGGV